MSLKVIQNEIIKFINTQNPEVLAIQGVLGNGKTFFWKKTLKEMKFSPGVFTKYSYVSLFGINSLDELKNAIFSSTLPCKDVGKEPSIETLNFNIMSLYPPAKKKWRGWMLEIIKGIPVLKNFREVIDSAIYLSLQDTIICLDDIEKKGDRLTIKEVMGLISFLKEQRNCKVAIIYNEDKIDPENKEQLLVLKEKVIDKNIEFSLTSEECCDISLDKKNKFYNYIKSNIIKLDIKNIRIIKKITGLVDAFSEIDLSNYSDKLIKKILHSLCLFCYCYYSKGDKEVPTIEFLKNLGNKMFLQENKEKISPDEELYLAYLREYGYAQPDSFDLVIFRSIERGFFNKEFIDETKKLNEQPDLDQIRDSLDKAWEVYHESFDDNAQEVIESLKNTYYQYAANIPVNYVDPMLTLFRDLGETTSANEILKNYIEILKERKTTINSDNYPFFDSLKDSKLIESLKVLEHENEPDLSIEKVLEEISLRKGWSEYHEKFLADCSVEDFYMVFKKTKGKKLSSYIYACLKFGKITPPKENYKKITNSAQLALKQIAKENLLNRARISKFSIHID